MSYLRYFHCMPEMPSSNYTYRGFKEKLLKIKEAFDEEIMPYAEVPDLDIRRHIASADYKKYQWRLSIDIPAMATIGYSLVYVLYCMVLCLLTK